MDSDIPSGAAAIGGRIENPLQDEDEQRRAANTRLLRLRQLRFIVVAIMVAAASTTAVLHCDSVEDLSIWPFGKKEWFPAESDPSVRTPWYLSRRVQRWKEDWTGRLYERQAQVWQLWIWQCTVVELNSLLHFIIIYVHLLR